MPLILLFETEKILDIQKKSKLFKKFEFIKAGFCWRLFMRWASWLVKNIVHKENLIWYWTNKLSKPYAIQASLQLPYQKYAASRASYFEISTLRFRIDKNNL